MKILGYSKLSGKVLYFDSKAWKGINRLAKKNKVTPRKLVIDALK